MFDPHRIRKYIFTSRLEKKEKILFFYTKNIVFFKRVPSFKKTHAIHS